ncbi:phosphotransferase [Sediminibacillus dalangtanensis]|uniref:Phosphotransferase n=1 Tax=Sediminibacillus dalangtanensis TaxID=2729421 RepID=A0ABX7VSQ2_9BACI|nr:phosphotransferase [Sediminibacillus dalangtanensis]QTM99979.1 phosphotransferase [Sediminibacillus dalangtanensis]
MERIQSVLQEYQIGPAEIVPITSRLYKIHTFDYTFALKRSRMKPEALSSWENVYRQANLHRLSSIVPVYLTEKGQLYVSYEKDIYYLSPWQEMLERDEPVHELEGFFRELTNIHAVTMEEHAINQELAQDTVAHELQQLESRRADLLEHVEQFEARRYMSPFELEVCTHYRDIEIAFSKTAAWFEAYLEDLRRDQIGRTCLCHGNLRTSHLLTAQEQAKFINWEHAFTGNPVQDLSVYFQQEWQFHDYSLQDALQSFPVYEKQNRLLQSEKSLLAILSINPSNYLDTVEDHLRHPYNRPLPFQIRDLERSYRRLYHGLKFQEVLEGQRQEYLEKLEEED